MERNGVEWNGIKISFHCFDILRRNETNFPLHCLKSGRNGKCYNFFIPFLPFSLKYQFVELLTQFNQCMVILVSNNTRINEYKINMRNTINSIYFYESFIF